jgi:tellurite resistance-related uncharacterized protein
MNRELPEGVVPGRKTPTFSAESVPPALLKAHHTTVWAELVVLEGSVEFTYESTPPVPITARAGERVVIVPNKKHHIAPDAQASFYVQFYDL